MSEEAKTGKSINDNPIAFGKGMEYTIVAQMLKEELDLYLPVVDTIGIDAVVRKKDGSFVEIQIKARSTKAKHPALFAGISHKKRPHYLFIFHTEGIFDEKERKNVPATWIMSSNEFLELASVNKKPGRYHRYPIIFQKEDVSGSFLRGEIRILPFLQK